MKNLHLIVCGGTPEKIRENVLRALDLALDKETLELMGDRNNGGGDGFDFEFTSAEMIAEHNDLVRLELI